MDNLNTNKVWKQCPRTSNQPDTDMEGCILGQASNFLVTPVTCQTNTADFNTVGYNRQDQFDDSYTEPASQNKHTQCDSVVSDIPRYFQYSPAESAVLGKELNETVASEDLW